jgi:hypothetical protein
VSAVNRLRPRLERGRSPVSQYARAPRGNEFSPRIWRQLANETLLATEERPLFVCIELDGFQTRCVAFLARQRAKELSSEILCPGSSANPYSLTRRAPTPRSIIERQGREFLYRKQFGRERESFNRNINRTTPRSSPPTSPWYRSRLAPKDLRREDPPESGQETG